MLPEGKVVKRLAVSAYMTLQQIFEGGGAGKGAGAVQGHSGRGIPSVPPVADSTSPHRSWHRAEGAVDTSLSG